MILNQKYYLPYFNEIGSKIPGWVDDFDFSDYTIDFTHRIIASAVFSSNIEGNNVDLNSYLNWRLMAKSKPGKNIKEINDLIKAYEFAAAEKLTEKNMLQAHKILSPQLLIKSKRGCYRTEPVGVFDEAGLIYVAVEPERVEQAMAEFFATVAPLLTQELSLPEIFYYAALIHLRFVHIHPFADGNGRTARVLEKWFLAEKAGRQYWKIPAEKYYKENLSEYYARIHLGVNYYELNYDHCLPFLAMLPQSLKI